MHPSDEDEDDRVFSSATAGVVAHRRCAACSACGGILPRRRSPAARARPGQDDIVHDAACLRRPRHRRKCQPTPPPQQQPTPSSNRSKRWSSSRRCRTRRSRTPKAKPDAPARRWAPALPGQAAARTSGSAAAWRRGRLRQWRRRRRQQLRLVRERGAEPHRRCRAQQSQDPQGRDECQSPHLARLHRAASRAPASPAAPTIRPSTPRSRTTS